MTDQDQSRVMLYIERGRDVARSSQFGRASALMIPLSTMGWTDTQNLFALMSDGSDHPIA
jgi:hypothetical protein